MTETPIPDAPWPICPDNGRREGWAAYFKGRGREQCSFPQARSDLQKAYREGWDAASTYLGANPGMLSPLFRRRFHLETSLVPVSWTFQPASKYMHAAIFGVGNGIAIFKRLDDPAHGQLMAKAPDMLAALIAAEGQLAAAYGSDPDNPGSMGSKDGLEALRMVRAVIARVTGK